MTDNISRHGRMVRGFSREARPSLRGTWEESIPTALPLLLDVVEGPQRLPARQHSQEMLRGKLRTLQADSSEVTALLMEMSAHLVSINSEDKGVFVTFKTFEEIWKFTTYYTQGVLGRCMETLLFDQTWWLMSVEADIGIEVSLDENHLDLLYKCILMQEGSLFAACSASQMFDSSTSGGDLYLEQGDIAQFEPPFMGSGWSVLCLADGTRGTAPKPALEPVPPFHQWFLKTCPENILVGGGKPSCDFPLHFATGSCVVTAGYDAEGPAELSVAPGDCIIIVGLLVSCFDWFLGQKEATKEVGLVKTSVVAPSTNICRAADILLDGEEKMFLHLEERELSEEAAAVLEEKSHNDAALKYKLDLLSHQGCDEETFCEPSNKDGARCELKQSLQRPSSSLQSDQPPSEEEPAPPQRRQQEALCFSVQPLSEDGGGGGESLLSALDGQDFREELRVLYEQSPQLLASSSFCGHADEDQLIAFLSAARETARKKRFFWPHTRLCFLLGKLCAGRSKFSQARVFFEEALSVPQRGFTDLQLLASIYSNLAETYLLQRNTEAFFGVSERLAALLMALPSCSHVSQDSPVLKFILKKAVLSHNRMAEARVCYLLARPLGAAARPLGVLPYVERLLALCAEPGAAWSFSPGRGLLLLGRLYARLGLRRLSMAAASRAGAQPDSTLRENLSSLLLAMDALGALQGGEGGRGGGGPLPAPLAPYLQCCLSSAELRAGGSERREVLRHQLTVCLSRLLVHHHMLEHAVQLMRGLINSSPASHQGTLCFPQRNSALIWLAWLHINNDQAAAALEIVDAVLAAMPEHCTSPQEGLLLNLRGVALRCLGDLRRAAESYQASADICQEYEDLPNWAVAQANQGLLCLKAGARRLAERHLTAAVQLFSQLDGGDQDNFITVLLELGHLYVHQQQVDYGKGCYEWALLLAIHSHLSDYQLRASSHLCRLYQRECLDAAQTLSYRKHQLLLLRHAGRPRHEAQILEAVGLVYLSLGTHRAYRAALDYTKSSLGIFIDLGCKQKEARGWLQAGNIYQLLGQTELVDLYVQVAQDVALSTGDTSFILELLEAAGDIFFNSSGDRAKAVTFYRDRALPLAMRSGSAGSRLRLLNKLSQLLLQLKLYEDAVHHAQTAVEASVALGDQLSQRVSYHRLALLHQALQHFELVEFFFLKALALCPAPLQFDEESFYYARVYQTLGDLMFYDLKDPFDAAGYYQLALAAAMDVGSKRLQLQLCTQLATIYHNFLLDRELSLFFYQKARGFAAELNMRRINISANQQPARSWQRQSAS